MKQYLYLILLTCFLSHFCLHAQVGIGSTNPQAVLDITASNVATPTNTDGILIPRVDEFPVTNPGVNQDGMLVFVTGNGTPTKGFYFWDDGTGWQSVNGTPDTNTQNTLDEAYNEGGAGIGRTITANNGAVAVNGEDGFEITGTYGSDITLFSTGTRLFFNPKKAAFRSGYVSGNQWNLTNIGNYSFASNTGTTARGEASFAANSHTTASGRYSTSFGRFAEAFSYTEMAIGSYPTEYTPTSALALNLTDRAFVIGNASNTANRSNAFEVWKDGRVIINETYTLPTTDGTNNQVLTTDGSGQVSWQDGTTNTLALTRITMSASQTLTGIGTAKINFDTVDFDLNSNFNTANDRFVATTAGYYRISGTYVATISATPLYFYFDIVINGTYVRRNALYTNTSYSLYQNINSIIYLSVNDYVEFNLFHRTSCTIQSVYTGSYFEIEQVR